MAYCRFGGDSDVYVYEAVYGGWTTHVDDMTFNDETRKECRERLEHLREVGYTVPQRAIDRLLREEADDQADGEGKAGSPGRS